MMLSLMSAGFFLFIVGAAIKARNRPVVSGAEQMLTAIGEVLDDFEKDGRVHIHGEVWHARSTQPLHKGTRVRVTAVDGLVLHVKPVSGES